AGMNFHVNVAQAGICACRCDIAFINFAQFDYRFMSSMPGIIAPAIGEFHSFYSFRVKRVAEPGFPVRHGCSPYLKQADSSAVIELLLISNSCDDESPVAL